MRGVRPPQPRADRVTPLDPADMLALAAAYAAATRAGDVAALTAMSEPDAVVWHNYDEVTRSADKSLGRLTWLHDHVPDLTWQDVAVIPTPEGFVWRAVMTGTAPGGPMRVPTCAVVTVSAAGRVARIDEYLDPAGTAVLARPA